MCSCVCVRVCVRACAEWGSTKTGEQEDLILTALNCVLKVPQLFPQERRFDIRVLVSFPLAVTREQTRFHHKFQRNIPTVLTSSQATGATSGCVSGKPVSSLYNLFHL